MEIPVQVTFIRCQAAKRRAPLNKLCLKCTVNVTSSNYEQGRICRQKRTFFIRPANTDFKNPISLSQSLSCIKLLHVLQRQAYTYTQAHPHTLALLHLHLVYFILVYNLCIATTANKVKMQTPLRQ